MLTLAYMNAEALERTRKTGEMHFWSRSRQELWHKGETSGNTMRLRAPALRLRRGRARRARGPTGPACHTGERTCFHAATWTPALGGARRPRADDRRAQGGGGAAATPRGSSQTGVDRGEGARGGRGGGPRRAPRSPIERVREEAADVLYHLAVLLASRDLSLADAFEELNARRR